MPHGVFGPGVANWRLALTTTVGVVDRVHRGASHRRALTEPTVASRLAQLDESVLLVAHLADGCHAVRGYAAHLTGGQAEQTEVLN